MKEEFTVFNSIFSGAVQRNDGFLYTLSGDLCQMSEQATFLQNNHFCVGRMDCYPALQTKDEYYRAIRLIYTYRINGWWNYRKQLVEEKICTDDEFKAAMGWT